MPSEPSEQPPPPPPGAGPQGSRRESSRPVEPGHGDPRHGNPRDGDPGHEDPGQENPGHGDPGHGDRGREESSDGTGTTAQRFAQPRRLHPASVVLGVDVRQLIQALLFPLAASFTARGRLMLVALLTVGAILLVARILAWQRFYYSFDGEVLRVAEGVLSRNQRTLDVARIQQVEIDRSLLQRLLGLAALRVETAGASAEVEVELRVVPEADAVALRSAIREGQVNTPGPPSPGGADGSTRAGSGQAGPGRAGPQAAPPRAEPASRPVLRVPLRHVVLGSATGVRLLVFPAVIAGAFQLLGQATDAWLESSVEYLLEQGVVTERGVEGLSLTTGLLLAALVLALSLVTAVVVGILRDARFRIERAGDDLHVSRGLLSTRDSVLPLRRIQLVQIQRNWIRRPLGYSSVRVHSAGGSGDEDRRMTVPLLPDGDVEGLLTELYPGIDGLPPLRSHPRPAVRRAVFRRLRAVALPLALAWFVPWGLAEAVRGPALVLLPIAVALGVVEHRHLAHGVSGRLVAARQGSLSVTTGLAPVAKVQAVSTRANVFQRRLGLATVHAHVAGPGGDVEVVDAGADDARRLHDRLTRHAADPAPADGAGGS